MAIFIIVIQGILLNLLYKSYKLFFFFFRMYKSYKLMCYQLQKYNLLSSKCTRGNLKSPHNLWVKNKIYSVKNIKMRQCND